MSDAGHWGEFAARLHSRYQPRLEAERYIAALNPGPAIDCFILIEPGLGYLIDALRQSRPQTTIIVLHADASFRVTEVHYPGIPMWFPDSETGVQDFLETHIPETASMRIIEWRPSLRLFGTMCLELVRHCTDFIKRVEANRRTSAAFGTRWVRNFFRNLTLIHRVVLYRTMSAPVVIAGAGPSLEAALPAITAMRENVFVLAASSAAAALAAGGITPDMVISTDGGGWALRHLYACSHLPVQLACALSAAIPSQCSTLPLLLLNDGSLWQNIVLHGLGLPSVLIPQRGTVTASALDLALALTRGGVLLAGMDLSVEDIKSHARPNVFDHLIFGGASRLQPIYSQYFMRSGAIREGGSLDVYAAWFKTKIASWPARIFSLGGNHPVFENSLPKASPVKWAESFSDCFSEIPINIPKNCGSIVLDALSDSRHAALLCAELAPLLFPARPEVTAAEIAGELRDIIRRYGGECG